MTYKLLASSFLDDSDSWLPFQTRKKELKKEADVDNKLLVKSSLDIALVPETEDDRRLASMIAKYRTVESVDEKRRKTLERLDKRSIFASSLKKSIIRKRPLSTSSVASTSASTSASSASGEDSVKAKNIETLKAGLREARVSSKLLKLDRDLEQQQASASLALVRKKNVEKSGKGNDEDGSSSTITRQENNLALLMQCYGSDSDGSGSNGGDSSDSDKG